MQYHRITPIGKPRMSQRDKWKKRAVVLRYRAFCDECRLKGVVVSEAGARITFVLPMPKSWSKKKRGQMDGQPHRQKPDADNLIKSLLDALYGDDACVWNFEVTKLWGQVGMIIISDKENYAGEEYAIKTGDLGQQQGVS